MSIATLQWNLLVVLACLVLFTSLFSQFKPQRGKKWYTPARILISLCLVFFVLLVVAYKDTFQDRSVSWVGFSVLVALMALLSLFFYYVQRVGHKGLRILCCFLLPFVICIGFIDWSWESELVAQRRDREYSERFVSLSQSEKNKYYTSAELSDALGIDFPEFDVIKYDYNPQWQEWEKHFELKLKRPISNSSKQQLDQFCQSDSVRWKAKEANVFIYAPNTDFFNMFGDCWTIDLNKGIIKYDRNLH